MFCFLFYILLGIKVENIEEFGRFLNIKCIFWFWNDKGSVQIYVLNLIDYNEIIYQWSMLMQRSKYWKRIYKRMMSFNGEIDKVIIIVMLVKFEVVFY